MEKLKEVLFGRAASSYIVHTGETRVDLGALATSLSATTQAFVEHVAGNLDTLRDDPAALYRAPWSDDNKTLDHFQSLSPQEKIEALVYFTVPLHEYTHHVDITQSPFGAWLHGHLANE